MSTSTPKIRENFNSTFFSEASLYGYDETRYVSKVSTQNFGWIPPKFPNPIENPVECGISSSLPYEKDGIANDDNATHQHIFFCDPDSVLNASGKEEVISTMRNFSFSIPIYSPSCHSKHNDRMPSRKLKLSLQSQYSMVNVFNVFLKKLKGISKTWNDISNISVSEFRKEKIDRTSKKKLPKIHRSGRYLEENGGETPKERNMNGVDVEEECDQYGISGSVPIRVAVAIAKKIDLRSLLQSDSVVYYEDGNDKVNDAAQFFSRYLRDSWDVNSPRDTVVGLLIFISAEDRVCYISTISDLSFILPWWRLDDISLKMRYDVSQINFVQAIDDAITTLNHLLNSGPPKLSDRFLDFINRFGVVLSFALFTVLFAIWGEYSDRQKRWAYTEARSKLTKEEKEKAQLLQKEYDCKTCPICLESFVRDKNLTSAFPYRGSDSLPLKLLRCGHAFDESCWKAWVNSGQGNPLKCPICRKDVGGTDTGINRDANRQELANLNERTILLHHDSRYGSFRTRGTIPL